MHVLRTGTSFVGLHFVANHAVDLARGWITKLKMLRDGPATFSLVINGTPVAHTTTGEITREHFDEAALQDIAFKTAPDDVFLQVPGHEDMINLTYQGRIEIVTDTPPNRQNYYLEQTWAQVFEGPDESALKEVPCMLVYNLRTEDASATIEKTVALEIAAK